MLPKDLEIKIEDTIKENKLEDIRDLLYKYAEPCIEICVEEEENYTKVGNSRIGGYPDLPSNIQWPCEEDEYYTFIAQINLSELPQNVVEELPKEGILYFFLGIDEPSYDIEHKVFYYNGDITKLEKTMPPKGKEEVCFDEREFISCKVSFNPQISIKIDSEASEKIFQDYIEIYEILCCSSDTIWGQADAKRDAYFYRNELGSLMFNHYKSIEELMKEIEEKRTDGNEEYAQILEGEVLPKLIHYNKNKELHEKGIEEWHSLLKLSSLDEVGMCWWDAGDLEFLINKTDLKNLNFTNTYADIASS